MSYAYQGWEKEIDRALLDLKEIEEKERLTAEEIEEVLISEHKNITDTVERYGDYFYRLAQAILSAQRKKREGR